MLSVIKISKMDFSDEESSSEHLLNDKNYDDTDDDANEIMEPVQKKGKNRHYFPICSLKTFSVAKIMMKNGLFGTRWEQKNSQKNIVFFKCKDCPKRIKVIIDDTGKCRLDLEDNFYNDKGEHERTHKTLSTPVKERGIPLYRKNNRSCNAE